MEKENKVETTEKVEKETKKRQPRRPRDRQRQPKLYEEDVI